MSDFRTWLVVIVVLVLLAPLASHRPDAVQRVLGLSGGAATLFKAAVGVVVVYGGVWVLLKLLHRKDQR